MRATMIFLALSATSCASFSSAARDDFARVATCPPNRVTVARQQPPPVAHTDATPLVSPPPDVAADPGRLAFWTKEHPPADPTTRQPPPLFVAEGCRQRGVYVCHTEQHQTTDASGRVYEHEVPACTLMSRDSPADALARTLPPECADVIAKWRSCRKDAAPGSVEQLEIQRTLDSWTQTSATLAGKSGMAMMCRSLINLPPAFAQATGCQ